MKDVTIGLYVFAHKNSNKVLISRQFQIKCYYNVENWQKSCRKKTVIQLIVVSKQKTKAKQLKLTNRVKVVSQNFTKVDYCMR